MCSAHGVVRCEEGCLSTPFGRGDALVVVAAEQRSSIPPNHRPTVSWCCTRFIRSKPAEMIRWGPQRLGHCVYLDSSNMDALKRSRIPGNVGTCADADANANASTASSVNASSTVALRRRVVCIGCTAGGEHPPWLARIRWLWSPDCACRLPSLPLLRFLLLPS